VTLIAINCQPKHAQILTDSAGYSPNLRHIGSVTKITHLHHLDAALMVGGHFNFGAWARSHIETDMRFSVETYDDLIEAIPQAVPTLYDDYLESINANADDREVAVLLLVGFSTAANEFQAWEFGSDENFAPTPIAGTYLHPTPWHLRPSDREYRLLLEAYERLGADPGITADIRDLWLTKPAPNPNISPADLIELAKTTRENRSMGGGIHIHGDLVHTSLRRGKVTTRTVWTFPADGPDFARFVSGTDHPVAQLADCYCGSGRNVLLCCRAGDHAKPCDCHSGKRFQDCCLTTTAASMIFQEGVW
jgi:hypothetical protein